MTVQTKIANEETEILDALAEIISKELEKQKSIVKPDSKGTKKPSKDSTKKDEKKQSKKSELENLVDSEDVDIEDSDSKDELINPLITELIDYSALAEEFHFEQLHYAERDSEYLPSAKAEHEAKYKEWEQETGYLMEGSETMDEVEAEDTIQEVIYAAVLGGDHISFEKRRRLDNWIKFNPGLFAVYKESAVVRSDNVNYALW